MSFTSSPSPSSCPSSCPSNCPSSGGMSTASQPFNPARTDCRPLRVRVKTSKTVVRPTVGLRVCLDDTMADIFLQALTFNDRFLKTEQEIVDLVSQPVDIIVSNAKSESTDEAVRVQLSTTMREALMYEDLDRVLFDIIPKVSIQQSVLCQ